MDINTLETYIPLIVGGIIVILFGYGLFSKPNPAHRKYGNNKKDSRQDKKNISESKMVNAEIGTDDKAQTSK